MSKSIKFLIGIIISITCLWFVFKNFDFDVLFNSFENLSWEWIILGFVTYLIGFSFRTLRWKKILSPIENLSFFQLFPILILGFFLNNILPARAGEIARGAALNKKSSIPLSSCLGSIGFERLMDLGGLMVIVGIVSNEFLGNHRLFIKIFSIFIIGIIGIFFVIKKSKNVLLKDEKPSIFNKLKTQIFKLIEGFKVIKSPSMMVEISLYSILLWLEESITIFFLAKGFHLDLSIIQSMFLVLGLTMGVIIPAAPGYVGTFELFGKTALMKLGFAEGQSISFIVSLHFFYIFSVALLSISYFFTLFKKDIPELKEASHLC